MPACRGLGGGPDAAAASVLPQTPHVKEGTMQGSEHLCRLGGRVRCHVPAGLEPSTLLGPLWGRTALAHTVLSVRMNRKERRSTLWRASFVHARGTVLPGPPAQSCALTRGIAWSGRRRRPPVAPPAEPGTPPTMTLAGAHRIFSGLSGNNLRKPAHILKWNFYLLCDTFCQTMDV